MRVVVTGATGLLGSRIVERLRDHTITAIARRAPPDRPDRTGAQDVTWLAADLTGPGPWQETIGAADAVIHLAGESLAAGRWTAERKRRLVRSRVDSTRLVAQALHPGQALLSASAVGIYSARGEEALDEQAAPGRGFLAELCQRWEEAAQAPAVRTVCLRFGVVLSGRGGALARMVPAFRWLVGGSLGDPAAWFPWIHEDDAAGLVVHALTQRGLAGPVNVVSPGLIRMRELAAALGRVLHRPALLRVPTLALRIAVGEMGPWINPGQKVIPAVAQASGYHYAYQSIEPALRAALS